MTVGEIIPVQSYDYLIYPHDSKFKVKWGDDGSTVYETTNQTDAYDAFEYCRDQLGSTGGLVLVKPFRGGSPYYPMSQALQFNAVNHKSQHYQACAGPCSMAVQLRATNNTPVIEFTSTGNAQQANTFENFYITHNQTGYTKSLIHFVDASVEVILRGLRFDDFGKYKGNSIGFEILTVDKSQYEIIIDTIISRGTENMFWFNLQQQSSITFISSLILSKIFAWNVKRVAKVEGIAAAQLLAVDFDHVHFQWSSGNSLGAGESVYDFGSAVYSWLIRLMGCQTWDIPVGTYTINSGTSSEIMMLGSNASHRATGSGLSKLKTFDYYSHIDGKATISPASGTKEYTITHNLGFVPRYITGTLNMNDDTIFPYEFPEKDWTTTTFKVKFTRSPPLSNNPAVTNSIILSWRAWY